MATEIAQLSPRSVQQAMALALNTDLKFHEWEARLSGRWRQGPPKETTRAGATPEWYANPRSAETMQEQREEEDAGLEGELSVAKPCISYPAFMGKAAARPQKTPLEVEIADKGVIEASARVSCSMLIGGHQVKGEFFILGIETPRLFGDILVNFDEHRPTMYQVPTSPVTGEGNQREPGRWRKQYTTEAIREVARKYSRVFLNRVCAHEAITHKIQLEQGIVTTFIQVSHVERPEVDKMIKELMDNLLKRTVSVLTRHQ
ncbi:hypothetical protein SELMODRAFT_425341 [Selaginella moellendorffii]|uniref:Uncharacterized protein n=1 Tax=Selaginella moellendorffii TaxID=88036 RepID=D8SSS9_SELML|nr:hypothetical protein SELMODRAFT_425341 [Selaginella moellendorffii]